MVTIKRLLPLIASMLILSGCATLEDDRAELLIAQKSFIAVTNSLIELRAAGAFSEEEIQQIGVLIFAGDELLDKWTLSVLEGSRPPDVIDAFNAVIKNLIAYRESKE